MSFHIKKCHQLTVTKKRNRIPTSYTLDNQTLERVASAKYLGIELTEILHWEKHVHPVKWCKIKQSEHLCIQESKGMPKDIVSKCPDTLLQRPCASNAGVCTSGMGPPSATSEVHIGDAGTMVSLPHPS